MKTVALTCPLTLLAVSIFHVLNCDDIDQITKVSKHLLPQYADLDEFLSENGIPVDGLPSSHLGHSTSMGSGTTNRTDSLGHGLSLGLGTVTKRERSPSPSDCMSPDTINNPPSPADSSE